jgi:hypothetical protein
VIRNGLVFHDPAEKAGGLSLRSLGELMFSIALSCQRMLGSGVAGALRSSDRLPEHGKLILAGRHVVAGSPVTYLEACDDGIVFAVRGDDPGPEVSQDGDFAPVCLGCLLEDWPEGEQAVVIAVTHGAWSA